MIERYQTGAARGNGLASALAPRGARPPCSGPALFAALFLMLLFPAGKAAAKGAYTLSGGASWYGSTAHGKLTANGDTYNRYALTAAHKKLPFGTVVRVRNKKNDRTALVRVNDRGPFVKKRVLDVSFRAAQMLRMTKSGVTQVSIEIVSDTKGAPLNKQNAFYVLLATEQHPVKARGRLSTLERRFRQPVRMLYRPHHGRDADYALCLGPFGSFPAAQKAFLKAEGNTLTPAKTRERLPALGEAKTPTLGIIEAPLHPPVPSSAPTFSSEGHTYPLGLRNACVLAAAPFTRHAPLPGIASVCAPFFTAEPQPRFLKSL